MVLIGIPDTSKQDESALGSELEKIAKTYATEEEDKPLLPEQSKSVDPLELKRIAREDRNRQYGYYITMLCLGLVTLIYVIDTIVSCKLGQRSDLSNGVIDLIKTVVLFVLGYLFGKGKNE